MRSHVLCVNDVQTSYWDEVMDEDSSDDDLEEDGIPTIGPSRDEK